MQNIAVIFDSDGVVVDSEPFSLAAFRESMKEQNVDLTDEDVMANCGLTDADIVDYVYNKYHLKVDKVLFHNRKHELYEQKVREGNLRTCDGINELLDKLQENNIPYALASSGSRKKIRFNLSRVNIFHRFPVIISGEDMERGKPHPDIFLAAAERLDIPPERCVVVEDSLNGVKAAHRAGMKCVALTGTFPFSALTAADFIVESLTNLRINTIQNLLSDNGG